MPTNAQFTASNYEADLLNRRSVGETRRMRRRALEEQRNDVESAISLDLQASRLEKQMGMYDDPSAGFSDQIGRAKRARNSFRTLIIAYIFIAIVDFWLATPDVAELLANKAMAMLPQDAAEGTAISVTPAWLRVCVGITLTLGFLAATYGLKKLSDTSDQQEAITALQPGDDLGFSTQQRMIWAKRGLKVAYMCILVGLFSHLYSYDLERARMMEEVRAMQQDEFQWDELGVSLSGGELSTDEASPQTGEIPSDDGDTSSVAALAKPALVIYGLLWILHGILVLLPNPTRDAEPALANFQRIPSEKKADGLREREGQVLRGILLRINESEGDLRDVLIREAQPVAARANEAARRTAMEVPESPRATEPSVSRDPANAATAFDSSGATAAQDSDDIFGTSPDITPSYRRDDEDPYASIFGHPA